MEPSSAQLTTIARLLREVAERHGVDGATVARGLAATRTMRSLGMTESCVVETEVQADACIRILEGWKWKARLG